MQLGCSYFGNRIVRYVARDMKALARAGFTYVVHTFSEFDLMFHRGNMRDIFAASHDAGLSVYADPWGVGKVFGGEPFTNFAARHLKDGCQVLDNGDMFPAGCPNNPLFRRFMLEWIEAAAECGADTVLWDEPHFHDPSFLGGVEGRWGCRCAHCRRRFAALSRSRSMPRRETPAVVKFKTQCIRDFLAWLIRQSAKRGLANALCFHPFVEAAGVEEKWDRFARMKGLAVLGTDPYWQWRGEPVDEVGHYARALVALARRHGIEPQIWIQLCRIRRGTEGEIARAIELAAAAGVRNIALWGFEGCAHESWVSCEDPVAVWRTALKSLRGLAKRD